MHESIVDIAAPPFWAAALIAVLVLTPLTDTRARRFVFAGISLALVGYVVGANLLGIAIAFLLFAHVGLRLASNSGLRAYALAVLLLGVSVVFLVHKWPGGDPVGPVGQVAATIGFSYVALRVADAARAVAEQRQPPPTLTETVEYLVPFHMLAAGPIEAYDQYRERAGKVVELDRETVLVAAERVASGLFKKFVVASTISSVFLTGFRGGLWQNVVEMQIYYVWVYLDFSAYSDIAVGVGGLLGVPTPENFRNPLAARNIVEFWERWHISLSQFIRRNLFIPGQLAMMRAFPRASAIGLQSIVLAGSFVACGLWHGLTLRFLAWGAIHAVGVVGCNLYREFLTKVLGKKGLKSYLGNRFARIVATVVTFEFVAFSLAYISVP